MRLSPHRPHGFVLLTAIPVLVIAGGVGGQGRVAHPIRVELSKNAHRTGESVSFHIANHSEQTVHYRFGCARPVIFKLEADGAIRLTTNTDDSLPDLRTLRPGEADSCRWDQRVWQDPSRSGRERYQHYDVLAPVPCGRYQLAVMYFLDAGAAEANENPSSVRSEVFTIR